MGSLKELSDGAQQIEIMKHDGAYVDANGELHVVQNGTDVVLQIKTSNPSEICGHFSGNVIASDFSSSNNDFGENVVVN